MNLIGSLLAALALGFVAGALARALIPNDAFRYMRGWRSWATSTVLGLLGAVVGWLIFHGVFGIGDSQVFDWGGVIGAFIGALIVVAFASYMIKRYARTHVAAAGRGTSGTPPMPPATPHTT